MNKSLIVLCLLLVSTVHTYHGKKDMVRRRLQVEKEQGLTKRRLNLKANVNSRRLQAPWRKMNIYFDMTSINNDLNSQGGSDRVAFYKRVFDATGQWWEGALQVNDKRSKIWPRIEMFAPRYQRELGFKFDSSHNKESYDLLIRVFWCPSNGNTLAYAGPFLRHPDSKRPITGTVCVVPFGDKNFRSAADSVNRAVGTMIHEFGHVISFISFSKFHSDKVKVIDNKYQWTGSKVLEKARKYYNCPSLRGVPLQNKNGRVGGHWSEANLGDELMTPTTGVDAEKVSPMTLALCEDTNWYKADYTFAENYNFNKGRGCQVFGKTCPSPSICEAGRRGFITSDYKGVGYCSQNSNGCAVERKFSNRDCMKGAAWGTDGLKYGASYGSNCVLAEGKFKSLDGRYIRSQSQVSVQANCTTAHTSYTLTFKNFQQDKQGNRTGDAIVRCTEKGEEEFNHTSNYTSKVKCHDPKTFCQRRFGTSLQTCDESCQKNGRCQHVKPPQSRRLQALETKTKCNASGKPEEPAVFNGSTPTTPVTNTNDSDQEWMCWCYKDGQRKLACHDLPEDMDGVGY